MSQTITAPTPMFAIGETVYVASVERQTEKLPCPDCLGAKKWAVLSPAGGEFTTDCPRCSKSYYGNRDLPSLDVEHWAGKALARTLTGMELHVGQAVKYRSSISGSSSWIVRESEAWRTEAEAQAIADSKAAEKNTEAAEKPEVLNARHFADLTLDEGKWDAFKNGVWNTQYHASNIVAKVREAVEGEDGEEAPNNTEALENLREALGCDFKYHVENLPFTPLVTAALASEDPVVKAAADALPDAMKALMTRAWESVA
ncbi:hypothetical protein [Sphingomonas sp. R86520]|uniref:hypothetical protein n=1 Tax=Sphingomonas sp. R86520 TaxID=3093859 RepID=UPI0036D27CC6